jgi:hypothetical protein
MYNIVLYLYVLIVFSLYQESFKLILVTDPLLKWFCHKWATGQNPNAYETTYSDSPD